MILRINSVTNDIKDVKYTPQQWEQSLPPPREGQDEVEYKTMGYPLNPLTPALSTLVPNFVQPPPSLESSQREMEIMEQKRY